MPFLTPTIRIREETLESGGPLQQKLNFRLRTADSSRCPNHSHLPCFIPSAIQRIPRQLNRSALHSPSSISTSHTHRHRHHLIWIWKLSSASANLICLVVKGSDLPTAFDTNFHWSESLVRNYLSFSLQELTDTNTFKSQLQTRLFTLKHKLLVVYNFVEAPLVLSGVNGICNDDNASK